MGSPWETHRAAVDNARYAIGELQDAIAVVTDRQENAMGAVIMAVGQNPNVGTAQNAMDFTAEIRTRANGMYRLTEQIKDELERYLTGF